MPGTSAPGGKADEIGAKADIEPGMSGFGLISSALPPGADVPGKATGLPVVNIPLEI